MQIADNLPIAYFIVAYLLTCYAIFQKYQTNAHQ